MEAKHIDHFADLESDLDAGETRTERDPLREDYITHASEYSERTLKSTTRQRVEVKCESCRGTGAFHSYTGRYVGQCFKCKGTGKILRAANYEQAKAQREARKVRKEQEAQQAAERVVEQWGEQYPAELAWLRAKAPSFEFAASLLGSLTKWGRLTEGQLGAVQKCLAKDAARQQAPAGDGLDISPLKGYYAVPDGETRLKLRVKHPGKDSRFHGWIFVDDGAAYGSQQKYGSQRPGGRYQGKVQEQLRAILADPRAAQIAYGKLTGICGVCGRLLEDEASVAAGIGPICASKGGF